VGIPHAEDATPYIENIRMGGEDREGDSALTMIGKKDD